jgi:hypothetical protein
VPIDVAMKRVVEDAKADPGGLVPALGRSDKATVLPIFGRPKPIPAPTAATPAAATPAEATPAEAALAAPPAAPMAPTGAGTGPAPVGGAGPLDKPATPGTPGNPAGRAPAIANPPAAAPVPAPAPASAAATPPKGNGK